MAYRTSTMIGILVTSQMIAFLLDDKKSDFTGSIDCALLLPTKNSGASPTSIPTGTC